jgi:5'-3' exonuclease
MIPHRLIYFAFDSQNTHIGATVRFLEEIYDYIELFRPRRICIIFDTPTITQRKIEHPDYKAERPSMDNRLRPQFQLTVGVAHRDFV